LQEKAINYVGREARERNEEGREKRKTNNALK
jgi:hypothetical protein